MNKNEEEAWQKLARRANTAIYISLTVILLSCGLLWLEDSQAIAVKLPLAVAAIGALWAGMIAVYVEGVASFHLELWRRRK